MENFKNQLAIFVPMTASVLIKLENDLDSINNQIEICLKRIENRKSKLNNDKAKDFLDSYLIDYQQQLINLLSSTLKTIDEINFEFNKLEFEIFDYKRSSFEEIENKIDNYVENNDLMINCLNPLLEQTKNIFKQFIKENEQNLIKKANLDMNIPLIDNELIEKKENYRNIDQQCEYLINLSKHKHKMLDVAEHELLGQQQLFDDHYQKNQQLKHRMQDQKCKIVEIKSQVRKLIFNYLNKIKRLDTLTDEKNGKIDEFRNSIKKYNKEGIDKLNEKKEMLINKIDEYDRKENDQQNSKDEIKDNSQSIDPTKLIKQIKIKKIKEKLNSLTNLFDKLIIQYENELKIRSKSTNLEQSDDQSVLRPRRNRRKQMAND